MDWLTEFFATIPDAIAALWSFGEGFFGLAIMIGSVLLTALFAGLAWQLRERQGWLSALFGTMTVLMASWWLLGILPSAWVFFADSQKELLSDQIIPSAIVIGPLEVATDFYNVFRDSIVMIQGTVVLIATFWFVFWWQKRFPQGLGEGEDRGPTSGGYK